TQADLAETLDKAVETISNIERGHTLTSIDTLYEIGKLTGVPLTYFVEGIGTERKISKTRIRTEEEASSLLQGMTDEDLNLALQMIQAIAERSST
ncbi:MAG TPA: helix-turn-helix transcriptional regulator, partial [Alphaproteobacteria bacterium]|nr:helix-turn-helix transcriptional regulator [Alphaproteobacteria bacterium]